MAKKVVKRVRTRTTTSNKQTPLILAISYIVIGILLCIFKGTVLNWLMTAIGVIFIVNGVLDLVANNVTGGAINLIIGLAIILCGWLIVEIALIVFGALLVVNGVLKLLKNRGNLITVLFNVLTIVVGIMLILCKWVVFDWFFIIIGVLFIIDGLAMLLGKK